MNDEKLVEFKYNDICTSYWRVRNNNRRVFRYRNGPVPGINKRANYRWWKGRTLSQERLNEYRITDEEIELLTPAQINSIQATFMSRRNYKECDVWNDWPRYDWKDRSWKNCTHRNRQYKNN
jgi:hypothetical protein